MFKNIILEYPLLVIKSIGKCSFEALGRIARKSADTIVRLLVPAEENFKALHHLAHTLFQSDEKLYLILDDTIVKKVFSRYMEGAGRFFDTRIGRRIMGYKLLVAAVTNGIHTIPLAGEFLFSPELLKDPIPSKDEIIKRFIKIAIHLFPHKKIIVVADGAFATIELLKWCIAQGISIEVRMHTNRKVFYKNQLILVKNIKELQPKGRQMSRTIKVEWKGLSLWITATRRINKHGEESIIFQAATYETRPALHTRNYKYRWNIEKMFRTAKQLLGLESCSARKIEHQKSHMSSVLLAYALAQLDMKKRKLKTPEAALRASKLKNASFLKHRFSSYLQPVLGF